MRWSRPRWMICAAALAAAVGACDPQVDPSYAGEPLVRLRGTASGFAAAEIQSGTIIWNRNAGIDVPSGPRVAEPVFLDFPATITFDVLGEPPDEAFFSVEGETASIAEGYLHLDAASGAIVGTAVDVVLVDVRGTVAPGSLTEAYLGGVRPPGFHVLGWRATFDLNEAQSYFAARCVEDMVAAGKLDAATAEADCGEPRRYKLIDSAGDLDTAILFYRGAAAE